MADDFEIGRMIAVDTAQVTIELNKDLKSMTRTTYEGALEVGRINSYVILPVGARNCRAVSRCQWRRIQDGRSHSFQRIG